MKKSKLLLICPVFLNQSETFIYAMLQKMKDFETRVICYDYRNSDVFAYPKENLLTLRSLPWWRSIAVEMGLKNNAVHQFMADWEPDVIHAQFMVSAPIAAQVKKYFSGRPQLVLHIHGQDFFIPQQQKKFSYIKNRLAVADLILTPSEYVKNEIQKQVPQQKNIYCYYTAIDAEYTYRGPLVLGDTVKVMMLGRMVEKKGFDVGIRAVGHAAHQDHDHRYELDIIGGGPLKEYLESVAKLYPIKVRFLTIKENEKVREEYAKHHLFLAPSKIAANGDREGLPRTVTEALAIGTPVIGAIHAGIPEAVIDHRTGLLFPEENVEAAAAAIVWSVKNWPEMVKYAIAGRQHFDTVFGNQRRNPLSVGRTGVLNVFLSNLEG
jgi:glycosyltransferase involved in cell wall biosynthesis